MKANQKYCMKVRLFAGPDYQGDRTEKAIKLFYIFSLKNMFAEKSKIRADYQ